MTDLSIIIVNWNTREMLAGCLESVAGCRSQVACETFVIDNASTDGSAVMVREHFPWVQLIQNTENVGFAAANNQGIREATGRYVVLLNSDTLVPDGALSALLALGDAMPRARLQNAVCSV